jgi:hypothetical protein
MLRIDPWHRKKTRDFRRTVLLRLRVAALLYRCGFRLYIRPSGRATLEQTLIYPERGLLTTSRGNALSIIFMFAASSKSVAAPRRALPLLPYSQSA